MLKIIVHLLIIIPLLNITLIAENSDLTKYVDPLIGTSAHGHTYPGASVPFGGVQLSPDTRHTGWDGCSAYHYSDTIVYGFSHTHLSGTGCSDYGDILFMPTEGAIKLDNGYPNRVDRGYASRFSHKRESAEAGYYSVLLSDYNIKAELTATKRCGFHKYTFPKSEKSNIIIDLKHRDRVIDSYIEIIGKNRVEGYRRSKAWAQDQHVYFAAEFSKNFASSEVANDDEIMINRKSAKGTNIKAYVRFETEEGEEIFVKVGISAVSIEGARKNLVKEISDWDFDGAKKAAKDEWNKELSKILVSGGSEPQKTVFYTALYHSLLNPNLFMDVDGNYRGMDLKVHNSQKHTNYTVFSLWDTYRATHPLFTIIERERTNDFIRTFLKQYESGGHLPIWELAANYTGCMIGYHAIPVIADAYAKGIRDYDTEKALKAMAHSAELDWLGLEPYKKTLCIQADEEHESVSKELEYAYDDWCIAEMAKKMNKKDIYYKFIKRAQSYKNIYDPETGFMRPKINGGFLSPFAPNEVNNHFTEANSWQYSFYVPQDLEGLISLFGGRQALEKRLDSLFAADSRTSGRTQSDISGLIGQYAHGNEPSHHTAYLYNYTGSLWKTQNIVRLIMDSLYTDRPDGLCGNEDCGQMSSWYVMSAMGFYSVCPGQIYYQIGSPLFKETKIHMENGKVFTIKAKNASKINKYIQSAKLNGKPYGKSYFSHDDIMAGAVLEFEMGPEPNKSWASDEDGIPKSAIKDKLIQPLPYVSTDRRVFRDSLVFELHGMNDPDIFYTLDGSEPDVNSTKFSKPITIKDNAIMKMFAKSDDNGKSAVISSKFSKIPGEWKIDIKSAYNPQYSAGGPEGLIDGLRGAKNFRLGGWQGYQNQDFEAVVDLGKNRQVNSIFAGFLQDARSWIWMPKSVQIYTSTDGKTYTLIVDLNHNVPDNQYGSYILDFGRKFDSPIFARYVKIRAKNYGDIPDWHPGHGGKAFIFIDEIMIETISNYE